MNQYQKISLLFCLLGFWIGAKAQNPIAVEQIIDKKWGLRHFIELVGTQQDTLFSTQDCKDEYLILRKDQTYEYSTYDRKRVGKWTEQQNGVILLLQKGGNPLVYLTIMEHSDRKLVLSERYKTANFINSYEICEANDTTFVTDSRTLYDVFEMKGISLAFQTSNKSGAVGEIGYVWGKTTWNRVFWGLQPSIEFAPWHNQFYAMNLTAYTQTRFTFGINLNANTNLEKVQVGIKPLLGISFRGIGGNAGWGSHLVYSYNFIFAKDGIDVILPNINRHAITLRFFIPTKVTPKKVRKVEAFEN